jgi:hypothetical protein
MGFWPLNSTKYRGHQKSVRYPPFSAGNQYCEVILVGKHPWRDVYKTPADEARPARISRDFPFVKCTFRI